jgi:CAAX protease family protein
LSTPSRDSSRKLLAPLWHTVVLVLILMVLAWGGARLQHRAGPAPGIVQQHSGIVPLYISLIISEWALVYFVWAAGLRRSGTPLLDVIGGRWSNWKMVVLDLAIALPFWIVWEATGRLAHRLLGPDQAKSLDVVLPVGVLEIVLWVAVSISAGLCEEVVFRGYLQKQFYALTGSIVLAVLFQGIVFGIGHSYQGLKQVVVITILGVLYGVLAAWRKNLRPGMIAHAFSDIVGGTFFK